MKFDVCVVRSIDGPKCIFDHDALERCVDQDHGRTVAFNFHQRIDEIRVCAPRDIRFLAVYRELVLLKGCPCSAFGRVRFRKSERATLFSGEHGSKVITF